jgi:hypothetical protein
MATSEITQSIKDITGISSVSTHSIEDAQRFAVASIPKNLLRFALNRTSISSDGSSIVHEINDSIIDVQRNGFSCKEIPFSESKWANDSTSLKKATASFPVYWSDYDGIKIAPDTDGSNGGYVFYINSAELDDDCDLRNAIIYRACSVEFEKLASAEIGTVSEPTYVPPSVTLTSAPSISDLSMVAVPPAVPTLTSVTFVGVDRSLDTVQPIVRTTNIAAASTYTGTAPTFTPPVMGNLDYKTFETHLDVDEDIELATGKIQEIQAKIGEFSAKLPEAQANYEVENVAYQSAIQESVQEMQAANQVAITNAQTELDNAKSNRDRDLQRQLQNGINDMQAIVQDNQRLLALYQAQQGQYSADVQKEVQDYQQTLQKELQIWQGERTAELQKFASDMQNALNIFNKENAIYQASLQISTYYSVEAKKYYDWSIGEITNYIQNNEKMVNQTIAARQQLAQQQQGR